MSMPDPKSSRIPPILPPAPKQPQIFLVGLVIFVVIILLYNLGSGAAFFGKTRQLQYFDFRSMLESGAIASIEIEESKIHGDLLNDPAFKHYETAMPEPMLRDGVEINAIHQLLAAKRGEEEARKNFRYVPQNTIMVLFVNFGLWALLLVLLWWLFLRQMRAPGGPGSVLSFGRSRAKLVPRDGNRVTFDDVAGIDEAKEEVEEIIEFLKDPGRFQKLGARIPRGVLLVGAPGTGKTLLAKAIAGEAEVPFYSICGSDFVEMFVGVGASRVRDLFRQAKESAPCIIFLDEIDAVGRRRGSGIGGGGHDEREQTLNAILVEMDGFGTDDGVIVMAATNRPDVLDPALLRPGRFDREIAIDMPDVKGREAILRVHAKKVKMAKDIDLVLLSRTTPTFSGADLEAVINEAALLAVLKRKDFVENEDLEESRDKVKWGRQKRSRTMEEADKRITAYHESGHAIVSCLLPEMEPLHKVTIIPRGMALGATMRLPEKDRYHMQRRYALNNIVTLFGGRAAEEVFCSDISAGAQDDIKKATSLARMMICEWGMSEKLGPIMYTEDEEHMFLGREVAGARNHSEEVAREIDTELRQIIDSCHQKARALIEEHRETCDRIARALLKYEVLSGTDVQKIIQGATIESLRPEESSARTAAV